ncbi:MAG: DUF4352 domain-containing protein, partial [Rubrobacter sp.]|nr:DUF4352 domain-containing protein [Rubrobacter sp.]
MVILIILAVIVEGTKNNSTPTSSSSTSSAPQSSSKSSSSSSSPSSNSQNKDTQPSSKIGDTVTVGDSAWVITDATPTSQLTPQFGSPKQGNFVTVDFNFTNNGDKAKTLSTPIIKLIDSTGREFSADTDSWSYVPADRN